MKVGLLGCDHVLEKYAHIAGDYPQMFADLFSRHAPQLQLVNFDVRNGEFPASVDACEAFVCTGSRYSAYDEDDWIQELKNFLRQLRDAEKPFVGICFGHQMMAEALGGKVEKSAHGWGIGVHSLNVIKQERWMQPEQSRCGIQYSHRDQVVRLAHRGRDVLRMGRRHALHGDRVSAADRATADLHGPRGIALQFQLRSSAGIRYPNCRKTAAIRQGRPLRRKHASR